MHTFKVTKHVKVCSLGVDGRGEVDLPSYPDLAGNHFDSETFLLLEFNSFCILSRIFRVKWNLSTFQEIY